MLTVNMTEHRYQGNNDPMMEPRDRLKLARQAAHLTIEELAGRTGQAVTTVRAHENGQNQIRAKAAEKYAKALVLGPSWLLFGEGMGPQEGSSLAEKLHQVPVIGRILHGAWWDPVSVAKTSVDVMPIYLPEYAQHELTAFEVEEGFGRYPRGAFVFVVSEEEANISSGDEVVISRTRDNLIEIGIWEVRGIGERQDLVRRSTDGVGLRERMSWDTLYDLADGDVVAAPGSAVGFGNSLQGVIVACQWSRRVPVFKPIKR